MRVRKNVKQLTPAEKAAFVNAVLSLKGRPSILHPGNPALSRYDDYPEIHMNAMMANPGWAHRGPAFFPWHRELLLQFENDLVAADSSVTIPYWDWTDAASSPFTADLLGGDGDPTQARKVTTGPFAHEGPNHWTIMVKDDAGDPDYLEREFGVDPTAPAPPTGADVNTVVAMSTTYDSSPWTGGSAGFRASLEINLHNLVHRWVGGTMGLMTSPNDPVFWLHHCNIDRLWAVWQRIHPGASPYLPVSGAAPGHNLMDTLIFNDVPPPPWPGSATPYSVINHHALGYRYDDEFSLVIPRPPLSFVRILFGVINDAPGVIIGPDGKPHPVPGGPGDPWFHLTELERSELVAMAIHEAAALLPDVRASRSIQDLALPHLGERLRQQLNSIHAAEKTPLR